MIKNRNSQSKFLVRRHNILNEHLKIPPPEVKNCMDLFTWASDGRTG